MQVDQAVKANMFGYIIAPIFPPTLNIFLSPLFAIAAGKSENAIFTAVVMGAMWIYFLALSIFTVTPAIWLLRKYIEPIPLTPKMAITLAVAFSSLASLILCNNARVLYSGWWIWLACVFSAAFVFSAVKPRTSRGRTG
jgi:hypothetical protein